MTTNMQSVSAESQRRRIPTEMLMTFDEITNVELASMATDDKLKAETRAFTGWELEYREAFGIEVYYDIEADMIKRRRSR